MDIATKIRVLKLLEDISFIINLLDLLFGRDLSFFQTFKSKILPTFNMANQFDGSKATSA